MANEANVNQPIRVLLWSPRGAGELYNGPGMNAARTYAFADPKRVRVTLFHAGKKQQTNKPFHEVSRVASLSGKSRLSQIGVIARSIIAIVRSRGNYDIFHGLGTYWLTIAPAYAAQLVGLPSVVKVTIEGTVSMAEGNVVNRLLRSMRIRAMRRISAFVVLTDRLGEQLVASGIDPERVFTIPNGVDTSLFHPASECAERQKPRILFAGTMEPRKRPHLLIEALPDIVEATGATLWMAGPCDNKRYHEQMLDRVNSLGVAESVEWLGFVSDMPQLYREVDVLCLPSRTEGMSNAVLEAMASGVPFVVTPASGMMELAQAGGGIVAEANARCLADAVIEALQSQVAWGESGRQAAVSKFSASAVLTEYLDLFELVCSRNTL